MPSNQPAVLTQTKRDNDVLNEVKLSLKRTVTYQFKIGSSDGLNLPYAVAIGGVTQEAFKEKAKCVNVGSGKIVVTNVDPGKEVSLYLNSDAHPSFRKNAVYAVTPSERDIVVIVTEKSGKRSETDTPVRSSKGDGDTESKTKADAYSATLNGDIWMKITHRYAPAEISDFLPSGTSECVSTAIKKIYDILPSASLDIPIPAKPGVSAQTLVVTFDNAQNARDNISSGFEVLREGLTRAHPAGYAALFTAAIEAGATKIALSSAWRPMLGSIAHRAGLGLDARCIGTTGFNREELTLSNASDTSNVSQKEKELFAILNRSKKTHADAQKTLAQANAAKARAKGNQPALLEAAKELETASTNHESTAKAYKDAYTAWNDERDKNEPEIIRKFRRSLACCSYIAQIFDPWFIDHNNLDKKPAAPNMQDVRIEISHRDHVHITVHEPKIYSPIG